MEPGRNTIQAVRFRTSHENSDTAKDTAAHHAIYLGHNLPDGREISATSDNVRMTILAKALIANNQNSRSAPPLEGRTNGEPGTLEPAPPPVPWVRGLVHRCLVAMQPRMRRAMFASILAVLTGWNPAVAQMTDTVPAIGTTSPLGMTADTPVPLTGTPMGATELPSAGLSPLPAGSMAMTSDGVACPVQASSSPGMSGTATTFDGGGMAMGMPLPGSTATSGTCGTGSTAAAPSSAMSTS